MNNMDSIVSEYLFNIFILAPPPLWNESRRAAPLPLSRPRPEIVKGY